ncbi:TPA: methyltransferase domain-containing protein [Aeromonas salmonicida]|nr:methyltransferase domain-containing protein [Aeromonas salmonicida]EKP0240001.1 methyltransferase domain-containing protein [Aeromonas salmonicida]EKP0244183.1 methyltransferase domain-containing protein [Aeromonas salmonicida]EKP0252747.1 methyltransferase domain-containing protein [Aeromonas salmonicida]EKP0256879.1 methyltransferase domain-containing protein [Aeromonas salmonicida]EKP0265473.1 methyltransferase domain-containing protein [Aeromonas salmonicida]
MKCPYCHGDNTLVFLERKMPTVLSAYSGNFPVKVAEMQISACKDCLVGFASKKLSSEELTEIYDNYLYISPLNNIGVTKYDGMIDTIKKHFSVNDEIIEIGCSEGYLLKKLRDIGFSNVTGIEPGPQADSAKALGLNVIKGYFDATHAKNKIDGYYLMHVFEHFEEPFSIFRLMSSTLNETGKIVIEVPNFGGFHVQHLFYYNLYFMQVLSRDNDLKVIDFCIENGSLRVVFTKSENTQCREVDLVFDKIKYMPNLVDIKNSCESSRERVNDFLRGKDTVFWWGAGSASVILLNEIERDVLDNTKIVVIDGDRNKSNLTIPGVNLKVNHYSTIGNLHINNLVIASSFYKEIFDSIRLSGITYDHVEVFSYA